MKISVSNFYLAIIPVLLQVMSDVSDFDRLIDAAFSPDDIEDMTSKGSVNPFGIEPVLPGRELLIETFHILYDGLVQLRAQEEWRRLIGRFGELIIPTINVSPGDELMIDAPTVFIDEAGPRAVLPNHKLFGSFMTFVPEKSFFVHQDAAHDSYDGEADFVETGDVGLYVALLGPTVDMCDGSGERISLGSDILVSLSNGQPELNRVLRPY